MAGTQPLPYTKNQNYAIKDGGGNVVGYFHSDDGKTRTAGRIPVGGPGLGGVPVDRPEAISSWKRVSEIQAGADAAAVASQAGHQFLDANKEAPVGSPAYNIWGIGAPIAHFVAGLEGQGPLAQMNTAQTTIGGGLRKAIIGGRGSQQEMNRIWGVAPSPGNPLKTNQKIVSDIDHMRTANAAYATFMTRYAHLNRGSLDGADDAWLNYRRKYFTDSGIYSPPGSAPAAPAPAAPAAAFNPDDWTMGGVSPPVGGASQ